jgi:hypothetical protein
VSLAVPILKRKNPADFLFRGNAAAASGFLTSLKGQFIPVNLNKPTVHGESSLPMAGGASVSSVRKPELNFPEYIRYSDCETSVLGSQEGESMVTTLRTSVKNVRVATSPSPEDALPDVELTAFQAESLAIEVRSIHPPEGDPQFEVLGEPQNLGMFLETVDRSGESIRTPIRLIFDARLLSCCTFEELDNEFLGNRDFFDHHSARFDTDEGLTFGQSRIPRTQDGYLLMSIVRQIEFGDETVQGNVLDIPGYGRISFGVMVTDRISRRISLVRIRFGSDPGGNSCLASVETNGIWQ